MMLKDQLFSDKPKPVFTGDTAINFARFASCFIVHLQLYPEIRVSIEMLKYSVYRSETFFQKRAFLPMLLGTAKFIGALSTEYFTISSLLISRDIMACIKGLVIGAIIATLDDKMAATLTSVSIDDEMKEEPLKYKKECKWIDDKNLIAKWGHEKSWNPLQWIGMMTGLLLHRILMFTYISVYFYFTPLLMFAMSVILAPDDESLD